MRSRSNSAIAPSTCSPSTVGLCVDALTERDEPDADCLQPSSSKISAVGCVRVDRVASRRYGERRRLASASNGQRGPTLPTRLRLRRCSTAVQPRASTPAAARN